MAITASQQRLKDRKAQEALTTSQKQTQLRETQALRKLEPTKVKVDSKKVGVLFEEPGSKAGQMDPKTGKVITSPQRFQQVERLDPLVPKTTTAQKTKVIGGVEHVRTDKGTFVPRDTAIDFQSPITGTEELNLRDKELFGDSDSDLFKTVEEQAADIKQREETEKSTLQAELERQQDELQIKREQRAEEAARTISAAGSAFAQGREGVQTSTSEALPGGFQRGIQREQEIFNIQIDRAAAQRAAATKELAEFQEKRRAGLVEADVEKERALRELIAKSEEAQAKAEAESKTKAVEQRKEALNLLEAIPDNAWASIPTSQAMEMALNAGLPAGAGAAIRAGKIEVANALASKNEIAIQQARADLTKTIESFGTDTDRDIEAFQTLEKALAADQITQDFFDARTEALGFATNPLDQQIKEQELALKTADSTIKRAAAQEALSNLYDYRAYASGGGVDVIDKVSKVPVNQVVGRGTDEQSAGQCGAFNNDLLEMPGRYGNSYDSKYANANEFDISNPQAGWGFVSTLGDSKIGHCGIIEAVKDVDGVRMATLVDSNRYGQGVTNRRDVPVSQLGSVEKITGYDNLSKWAASQSSLGQEMDIVLNQVRNGFITKTEIAKWLPKFVKAGRGKEFEKATSDPANKLINENTATKFSTDLGITKNMFDKIIKEREAQGFGNKTFQGAGDKEFAKIAAWEQMRNDLLAMKVLKGDAEVLFGFGIGGANVYESLTQDQRDMLKNKYGITKDSDINTGGGVRTQQWFAELFDIADADKIDLDIIAGRYTVDYMREASGVAISEQEAARLQTLVPGINMSDTRFIEAADASIRDLDKTLENAAARLGFASPDDMFKAATKAKAGEMFNVGEKIAQDTFNSGVNTPYGSLQEAGDISSNEDIINNL